MTRKELIAQLKDLGDNSTPVMLGDLNDQIREIEMVDEDEAEGQQIIVIS